AAWNAISFNAGLGWSFRSNTTPSESTITRAVTHRSVVSSAIEAEALAILAALTQARSLGFSFIPRSANYEADLLAKHVLCTFVSTFVPRHVEKQKSYSGVKRSTQSGHTHHPSKSSSANFIL
ncbi:hypothetical protein ISN45_At03g032020, partial [Arabidopsis thaliana x Arabidopsis arenosa]